MIRWQGEQEVMLGSRGGDEGNEKLPWVRKGIVPGTKRESEGTSGATFGSRDTAQQKEPVGKVL